MSQKMQRSLMVKYCLAPSSSSTDMLGHNRQCDQLRVGMLERGSGGLAVVLEDHDVLEAAILLEIDDAVAPCPEHALDILLRQQRQMGGMVRASPR